MDASEHVADAKLYRASGELLLELEAKLPQLVWRPLAGERRYRRCVFHTKTEELVVLLEKFQEWPQLLDAHLASFLRLLCNAFLSCVTIEKLSYERKPVAVEQSLIPLSRAICRLLYVFCKVRGQKVIIRFFNNEPKYIEPMLVSLRRRAGLEQNVDEGSTPSPMVWEERYIMLLWLSHLMLAPFDLSSISSSSIDTPSSRLAPVLEGLPVIAKTLLLTAFEYITVSSREREAAAIMIVRLSLRGDMKVRHLLPRTIDYVLHDLNQVDGEGASAAASAYRYSGLLSLISGILNIGSDDDVAPYLSIIFNACLDLATAERPHEVEVRSTAPVRKHLIKSMRLCILHGLSLAARQFSSTTIFNLDTMLEETIQYLLDSLSDKDTPVRLIASKSLSMIALKLEDHMSTEVIQAVLESLNENILLEDSYGKTLAITEVNKDEANSFKKIYAAVDPLRWHGLMLTLGHLLFRRSPPPRQLGDIISALISGLEFEQRSNVGTSIGVGVRDAACFGIWSLARKYNTIEINAVDSSHFVPALGRSTISNTMKQSTLQVIANQLVLSACLDPSGNIRRGSSAALQELIGRHPDTILQGIPVVQVVDYHAVARRSRAMTEVSLQTSKLDDVYLDVLLEALVGWRGARSADADSRRWAAEAISNLLDHLSIKDTLSYCSLLESQALKLKASNVGNNAGVRHGVLLSLSAILRNIWTRRNQTYSASTGASVSLESVFQTTCSSLDTLVGTTSGRATPDLEMVFEASSVLLAVLAGAEGRDDLEKLLALLERCLTGSKKDHVISESTNAFRLLFERFDSPAQVKLLQRWLLASQSKTPEYKCRGRIEAVGMIFWLLPSEGSLVAREAVLEYLEQFISRQWSIETKIYAVESLKKILLSSTTVNGEPEKKLSDIEMNRIAAVILTGLNDYTIDQRGDIGSTLRLKSIEAAKAFVIAAATAAETFESLEKLVQNVARLAAEKLDKLRFQSWLFVQKFWKRQSTFPVLIQEFNHVADISSTAYYAQLCELINVEWLQKHIVKGLVSSASAATEDICRASRTALTKYMIDLKTKSFDDSLHAIFDCLVETLQQVTADEREAVPVMETLAFILEQQLVSGNTNLSGVVSVMQKAHTPSSSIQRLEAAMKVYAALYNTKQRQVALDKLTRLLLHRYPKIRNDAADTLFFHTAEESFVNCDWTLPVADLKPAVLTLRKKLAVV